MKKVKLSILLLTILLAITMIFTACDQDNGQEGENNNKNDEGEKGDKSTESEHTPMFSEGLSFKLFTDKKSYYVAGIGSCTDLDVVIPSTYNDLPVTCIRGKTFYNCNDLTSVTIPNSITSIGEGAFENCSNLTSITIPDSITSIEKEAFYGCNKLVEVYNLSDLSITMGSTDNGYIGYYALDIYTDTNTPSKLRTDSNGYKFYEDEETCYLIGYTGTETELTLPQSYNGKNYGIYQYAFSGCSSLRSITIPDSVTSIGSDVFSFCTGLTSITIPNSVTSIGGSAFEYCTGLTSITIPSSVTSIGSSAFRYCRSLTSVTIPDSVTSIGWGAFGDCSSLSGVYISDIAKWCAISLDYSANPLSYAKNLYLNGSLVTELVIPDSVTGIGAYAFSGCSNLTSITIPNSVTSIGGSAFEYCTGLTSITIPNSVTSIGEDAFYNCSSLTSITIPDSVTSISDYAFYNCSSLTSITIPDSVTSISDYTFYYCSNLTSINYTGTQTQWNAITKGSDWDYNTGNYTIIYNYSKVQKMKSPY